MGGELQRAIFENALDGMLVLNSERQVLDANESALQLFEYTIEELKKLRWDDLIPAERRPDMEARWNRFLESGSKRGEMVVQRSNGRTRLVEYSWRAQVLPGRHLITLKDVTDHREAEESLRTLSQRLIRLQDDERRRIARELHDSTGQSLAALRMHLEKISATPCLPESVGATLREAEETCQSCSTEIRTISYLLHPPLLDEVGLLPALEWYLEGFSERSGVRVEREISEPARSLSQELNTALFRIIQEALVNIHKHAETKEAKIRLNGDVKHVVLEIRDRGKGINPSRMWRRNDGGVGNLGVGLTGMRERVHQLGGSLEILRAHPGTLIRAILPAGPKSQ
jgi:PAS domain S-box-containing protein